MRRTGILLFFAALGLRCATTEDEANRKVPGGFVDAASDQATSGGSGGNSGSGGSGASGGTGGSEDSGHDVTLDVNDANIADATPEANDANDAGPDADAGPTGTLVLLGRSATQVLFGAKESGSWTTSTATFTAVSAPAITSTSTGALAVVRRSDNELDYATWAAGVGWSALFPVGTAGATLGTPALARHSDALLVFLGSDNKLYENRWNGTWQGFAPVTFGSVQSFGPSAPALGTLPAPAYVIAQEGSDGDLYTQTWSTTWQAAYGHGLLVDVRPGTPPSVARRGTNAVVVYVESGTDKILWTEGAGTTWSNPSAIGSASTTDPVALTTLDNGDVLVAYRGKDQKVATSILSGTSFSTPVPFSDNATGSPSVAPGIDGHEAEIAFLTGGAVVASSLDAGSWSTPAVVATGNQEAVAITRIQP
jgi:hypothetical protein